MKDYRDKLGYIKKINIYDEIENLSLEKSESLNHIYRQLLDLTFEDRDSNDIIDVLFTILDSNVFIFDQELNIRSKKIICGRYNKDTINIILSNVKDKIALKNLEKSLLNVELEDFFISIFPIIKEKGEERYLCLARNLGLEKTEEALVQYSLSILSIKLKEEVLESLYRDRFNKTLLEILLNSNDLPKDFLAKIEEDLAWNSPGGLVGISIKLNSNQDMVCKDYKKIVYKLVSRCLGLKNHLARDKDNAIFVILKLRQETYLNETIDKLKKAIDEELREASVSVGVSNSYDNLSHIKNLYDESYLSASYSKESIVYYHLLDNIKLFYPLKDDKQIRLYYEKTIQKIYDYDRDQGMNLLASLESYLENNMNKKDTASKLFIHVETLRYRLRRIHDITGYSVDEAEGIFTLKLGLKFKKIIELK